MSHFGFSTNELQQISERCSLLSLEFFTRLQSISEFQAALELTIVTGTFLLLVCTHDTFQIKIRKAFLYKCVTHVGSTR